MVDWGYGAKRTQYLSSNNTTDWIGVLLSGWDATWHTQLQLQSARVQVLAHAPSPASCSSELWEAAGVCVVKLLLSQWRHRLSSQLLPLTWPNSDCCEHLRAKQADASSVFLLSNNFFKIKQNTTNLKSLADSITFLKQFYFMLRILRKKESKHFQLPKLSLATKVLETKLN